MSKLNYKKIFTVLFLLVFSVCAFAQTPQYYNYQGVGTSSNTFPFGQSAGKAVNWLFLAGDFNQPTPLPAGQRITKVYFYTTGAGTRTFTNLHILMAQDTITSLTTAQFYAGPWDTVFVGDTSLTCSLNGWMAVNLKTKYNYDPTKSLLVFVGQCSGAGTGMSIRQNVLPNIRRTWSVGGCPFVPYAGGDGSTVNFGVDVEPATPPVMWPEVLYYKFKNNPTATSVINYAVPGQGTNPAIVTGLPLTSGGQFDSCLSGTGGTGASAFINTGWSWNLTGNWTIGFWISNLLETSSGSPCYLFGDPGTGSLRCFYGGAALPNNTIFRGPFSATGYTVSTPMPGSYYIHYVWNGSAIKIYKNGVIVSTNPTTNTMPAGTGFKVGGYSTSSYSLNGKMDEFRIYNRALDSAEIANTWNQNIGVITGITPPVTPNIPAVYSLSQNYPNPFNPVTKINFAIPKSGFVSLKVYDMLGREVAQIVNETRVAGNYEVEFNASALSSGTYFYRLESNGFIDTKKMMVIK